MAHNIALKFCMRFGDICLYHIRLRRFLFIQLNFNCTPYSTSRGVLSAASFSCTTASFYLHNWIFHKRCSGASRKKSGTSWLVQLCFTGVRKAHSTTEVGQCSMNWIPLLDIIYYPNTQFCTYQPVTYLHTPNDPTSYQPIYLPKPQLSHRWGIDSISWYWPILPEILPCGPYVSNKLHDTVYNAFATGKNASTDRYK